MFCSYCIKTETCVYCGWAT